MKGREQETMWAKRGGGGEGHRPHGGGLPVGDKSDTFALWALGGQEVFEQQSDPDMWGHSPAGAVSRSQG